jgi:hypothetical protein
MHATLDAMLCHAMLPLSSLQCAHSGTQCACFSSPLACCCLLLLTCACLPCLLCLLSSSCDALGFGLLGRFLLPAAHTLLQQLPAALISISSLQQLLTRQGADALRLQQQLLPGYGVLLTPDGTLGTNSSSSSSAGLVTPRGLTQMQFELQATFTPVKTGWFTSKFVVFLNDEHIPAAADGDAAAAGRYSSKLVAVDGSKAVLLADSNSSGSGSSETAEAAAAAAAGGTALQSRLSEGAGSGSSNDSSSSSADEDGLDDAVMSIAELLPDRCE